MEKEVSKNENRELIGDNVKITFSNGQNTNGKSFSPLWRQSATAFAIVYTFFVGGLTSGFSAVLLPQLKDEEGPIPSSVETDSWIASISVLSMMPGCILSGWLMNRFGRRRALYILSVPLIANWLIISWADKLWMMLLGRFLGGLCLGYMGTLSPIYIGETTEPKYRGFFLAGPPVAIALGVLFSHLVGTYVSWQRSALFFAITPLISLLLLLFIPESPLWLITNGRTEEGIKVFGWLRGYSDAANEELKGLLERKVEKTVFDIRETLKTIKSPIFYKPTAITTIVFTLYNFCGINVFVFYAVEMVQKSVGSGLDHHAVMLIMDAVRIVTSGVGCMATKRYRRRPLGIISGIWTGTSLFILCGYLHWFEGSTGAISWIPVICLMSYTCSVSMGVSPLLWTVVGEIFPTKVRALGASISNSVGFITYFGVIKLAPRMLHEMGEIPTFLFYGTVGFMFAPVLFFVLPETFGKTIGEVEEYFDKKKVRIEVVD